MALYHFQTTDGDRYPDHDGTELPDLRAAAAQALNVLSQLVHEKPDLFWDREHLALDVTDPDGLALFRLHVAMTRAPCTMREEPAVLLGDLALIGSDGPVVAPVQQIIDQGEQGT